MLFQNFVWLWVLCPDFREDWTVVECNDLADYQEKCIREPSVSFSRLAREFYPARIKEG